MESCERIAMKWTMERDCRAHGEAGGSGGESNKDYSAARGVASVMILAILPGLSSAAWREFEGELGNRLVNRVICILIVDIKFILFG
jgi:hypothetical protein